MTDKQDAKNVIQLILDGMPPWQKSILTFVMIAPLALALSGLVLQVNVGSIIQAIFNEQMRRSSDQTVLSVRTTITEQMRPVLEQLAVTSNRLDAVERRTDDLAKAINSIKIYICDTDTKARGNCALMKP